MHTAIVFRAATVADLQAIQRLHDLLCRAERDSGFSPDIPLEWSFSDEAMKYFRDRIEGSGIALVAESAGDIVGYLLGGTRETRSGPASAFESIFVEQDSRRRGIGDALVRRFLEWHAQSGRTQATVAVAPANAAAIALYRKAGWVMSYDCGWHIDQLRLTVLACEESLWSS